jgi:magnesium-transporting ATPase (P-type)
MTQFYFSFCCLGSGQTFVDDWYITCYNLIFTALPLCVSALTESDIDIYDNKVAKKNIALLYKDSRDTYNIFSFKRFIWTLFKGTLYSLIIFTDSCFKQILVIKGYYSNIWYLSLKCYICVLSVVSSNLLINNNFIAVYLPLSIAITTFLFFAGFLMLNHYGLVFDFNSKASIIPSLAAPVLYFSIFYILGLSIIIDYSFKLLNILYTDDFRFKILLKNTLRKGKKKNSIELNKLSSKSIIKINSKKNNNNYNKFTKTNKIRSSFNPDISKNKLVIKQSNFFFNNINKNKTLKQKNFAKEKNNHFINLKFRGSDS